MWSKTVFLFSLSTLLWSVPAYGGEGKFTFVPKNGLVPFESTCFDNEATAKLLTWKEFQEKEFQNRLNLQLGIQREELTLEIDTLRISLEETTIRYDDTLRLRDEEIESLRTIIKKDRKVNLPLIIAGSVAAGVAIGVGTVYTIDKVFQ